MTDSDTPRHVLVMMAFMAAAALPAAAQQLDSAYLGTWASDAKECSVEFSDRRIGRLLIVDQLYRSLHPLLVQKILNMYNNPEVNTKGAQLILSTHDVSLLEGRKLRRDQIWFTEKVRRKCCLVLWQKQAVVVLDDCGRRLSPAVRHAQRSRL